MKRGRGGGVDVYPRCGPDGVVAHVCGSLRQVAEALKAPPGCGFLWAVGFRLKDAYCKALVSTRSSAR